MKLNVKTKIRYNGQDYSDPTQLPPEIRAAYEKAMKGEEAAGSVHATRKFVLNGQEFSNPADMPTDVCKLCEDVMSVIENNGEVTLPNTRREPLMTKRQLLSVLLVVGMLLALAFVSLATR